MSLNWTMLSERTSLQVSYRVDCITEYAQPEQVWFTRNNNRVAYSLLSQHRLNSSLLLYNSSLTMIFNMQNKSQVFQCVSNVTFDETATSLVLEG